MGPGTHSWYVVVETQMWHSLVEEAAPGEQGKDSWDVAGTQEGE